MWIFTQAVICSGQNNMQNCRLFKFRSEKEAVYWLSDVAVVEIVWVSELTISCQETKVLEALQYYSANPCIVQWEIQRSSECGQFGHHRSTVLDDGYSKILLLEIDTYCIGQHA